MAPPLDDVMVDVLREFGGVMSQEQLAAVIADRRLYQRPDGMPPSSHDLVLEAARHPERLESAADGSGRLAAIDILSSAAVVFAADVGSVKSGNFGWACNELAFAGTDERERSRPSALAAAIVRALADGRTVALGFECPLFVPVPNDEMALGRARSGEGNRAWSAGAGTGALATGLVQAAWVLDATRRQRPDDRLYVDWGEFVQAGQGLFLWEAFVSGSGKGTSHVDDAALAVTAFQAALPNPRSASSVTAERPLSLIGAAALWSGWSEDPALLNTASVVIRA